MPDNLKASPVAEIIEQLKALGYEYNHGEAMPERRSREELLLTDKLIPRLLAINPEIPECAFTDAAKILRQISIGSMLTDNEAFHKLLIDGVPVEYWRDEEIIADYVRTIDFENPENNSFLVTDYLAVTENSNTERPDLLIFINGIPTVIFALSDKSQKNAFDRIEYLKRSVPSLFTYNELCVVCSGVEAMVGSLSAPLPRYSVWKTEFRTDDISESNANGLTSLLTGLLNQKTLLDYIRNFITFEKMRHEAGIPKTINIETVKKIAAYHQYYAVNKAVKHTIAASGKGGSKKAGIVWHTHGAGKSLSIVFYTGKIVQIMNNPTIVIITDRGELDCQLFDIFAANSSLIRQPPQQATSFNRLVELLRVSSGGIIFTTIQKFFPHDSHPYFELLSERDNIVVIANEAHLSQLGFAAKMKKRRDGKSNPAEYRLSYGLDSNMRSALPFATYLGFTGAPIKSAEPDTLNVFGGYIDIYDIAQSVGDKMTVRVYYDNHASVASMTDEEKKVIDDYVAENFFHDDIDSDDFGSCDDDTNTDIDIVDSSVGMVISNDSAALNAGNHDMNDHDWDSGVGFESERVNGKTNWILLEKVLGKRERLRAIAKDIVTHFESRQKANDGKALVTTISRKIAVLLYDEIIKLRPEWHSDDFGKGVIKTIITSNSSDAIAIQSHQSTRYQRKMMAMRMKDETDPLKIAIVRDAWLSGFDAPCLHTLYIDKPLRGCSLVQAFARVNRVFRDKPGGVVVDYLEAGANLKRALSFYTDSGGNGIPVEPFVKTIELFTEKLVSVRAIFDGTELANHILSNTDSDRLSLIAQASDFILSVPGGKNMFIDKTTLLSQAYSLAQTDIPVAEHANEVSFYQSLKFYLLELELAPTNMVGCKSVLKDICAEPPYSILELLAATGIGKLGTPLFSDEFFEKTGEINYKYAAAGFLAKALHDDIYERLERNPIKLITLTRRLKDIINKYDIDHQPSLTISSLTELARESAHTDIRNEKMGLNDYQMSIYDALEVSSNKKNRHNHYGNFEAGAILQNEMFRQIALELSDKINKNATIDWIYKESVRARMSVLIRRTLQKYNVPADEQERVIKSIIQQSERHAVNQN